MESMESMEAGAGARSQLRKRKRKIRVNVESALDGELFTLVVDGDETVEAVKEEIEAEYSRDSLHYEGYMCTRLEHLDTNGSTYRMRATDPISGFTCPPESTSVYVLAKFEELPGGAGSQKRRRLAGPSSSNSRAPALAASSSPVADKFGATASKPRPSRQPARSNRRGAKSGAGVREGQADGAQGPEHDSNPADPCKAQTSKPVPWSSCRPAGEALEPASGKSGGKCCSTGPESESNSQAESGEGNRKAYQPTHILTLESQLSGNAVRVADTQPVPVMTQAASKQLQASQEPVSRLATKATSGVSAWSHSKSQAPAANAGDTSAESGNASGSDGEKEEFSESDGQSEESNESEGESEGDGVASGGVEVGEEGVDAPLAAEVAPARAQPSESTSQGTSQDEEKGESSKDSKAASGSPAANGRSSGSSGEERRSERGSGAASLAAKTPQAAESGGTLGESSSAEESGSEERSGDSELAVEASGQKDAAVESPRDVRNAAGGAVGEPVSGGLAAKESSSEEGSEKGFSSEEEQGTPSQGGHPGGGTGDSSAEGEPGGEEEPAAENGANMVPSAESPAGAGDAAGAAIAKAVGGGPAEEESTSEGSSSEEGSTSEEEEQVAKPEESGERQRVQTVKENNLYVSARKQIGQPLEESQEMYDIRRQRVTSGDPLFTETLIRASFHAKAKSRGLPYPKKIRLATDISCMGPQSPTPQDCRVDQMLPLQDLHPATAEPAPEAALVPKPKPGKTAKSSPQAAKPTPLKRMPKKLTKPAAKAAKSVSGTATGAADLQEADTVEEVLAPQAAQPMADIKAATMEPERINPSLRPQEAAEKPSAESRPEAAQPTKGVKNWLAAGASSSKEVAPDVKVLLQKPLSSYPVGKEGTRELMSTVKEAVRVQMGFEGHTNARRLFTAYEAPEWWPLNEWSSTALDKNKPSAVRVIAAMRHFFGVVPI